MVSFLETIEQESNSKSAGARGTDHGFKKKTSSNELKRQSTVFASLARETTLIMDLHEFGSDTSAHGLKYVSESPNLFTKVFFFLMWVSAVIYAMYGIGDSIKQYAQRPTGTKYTVVVNEEMDQKQYINFPTITVCSVNKIRKSYIEDPKNSLMKEYLTKLESYTPEVIEDLIARFNDTEDEMSGVVDITYESVLQMAGTSSDRFIDCRRRSVHCAGLGDFQVDGRAEVSVMETSAAGTCWRINPNGTLKGKMGDYGAVTLKFWADVQDYSATTANGAQEGFLVGFHDNDTYGSTMSSGHLMSPGNYYKADLRYKEMRREERCVPAEHRTVYGGYSEGACIMECKDKFVHLRCGCVQVTPPENGGSYRACTLKEWATCGMGAYLEWFNGFTLTAEKDPAAVPVEGVMTIGREEQLKRCKCQPACSEKQYEASVSSSSVSKAFVNHIYPFAKGPIDAMFSQPKYGVNYSTPEDLKDNMMVLEVLFSSMQKSQIDQVITYNFYNLLGDIGGVLGLFLGASMFTIIEFILFAGVSMAKYCCKATASGWLDVT